MQAHLDRLFCKLMVLKHHVQVAHWQVIGPHFLDWHNMYAEQYETLDELLDEYAELLIMHDIPFHTYLKHIVACQGDCHQEHHTRCPIQTMKHLECLVRDIICCISDLLEHPLPLALVDYLSSHMKVFDKMQWYYRSILTKNPHSCGCEKCCCKEKENDCGKKHEQHSSCCHKKDDCSPCS
ncbi:MAG: hypothetical protein FJ161_01910 [Gammaproteobacteria bacterium]|nr:hypothetical protein [Gammaproteobacteria bacterium]